MLRCKVCECPITIFLLYGKSQDTAISLLGHPSREHMTPYHISMDLSEHSSIYHQVSALDLLLYGATTSCCFTRGRSIIMLIPAGRICTSPPHYDLCCEKKQTRRTKQHWLPLPFIYCLSVCVHTVYTDVLLLGGSVVFRIFRFLKDLGFFVVGSFKMGSSSAVFDVLGIQQTSRGLKYKVNCFFFSAICLFLFVYSFMNNLWFWHKPHGYI